MAAIIHAAESMQLNITTTCCEGIGADGFLACRTNLAQSVSQSGAWAICICTSGPATTLAVLEPGILSTPQPTNIYIFLTCVIADQCELTV